MKECIDCGVMITDQPSEPGWYWTSCLDCREVREAVKLLKTKYCSLCRGSLLERSIIWQAGKYYCSECARWLR